MIRVFLYLLAVVIVGAGFAWLANYPGDLVVTVNNTRITLSLLAAFSVMLAAILGFAVLWWLVKAVVLAPVTFRRRWQNRRQEHGYEALSAGLIAAFAGDAATARRMLRQSGRRLNSAREPLLPLLEAQTKLLDLDHEGAVRLFEKMRKNPHTRLLALKGLFREALTSGAAEAASQFAAQAAAINPALKWASLATVEKLAARGEWRQAVALFDTFAKVQPKAAADGEKLRHYRAALLTGQAQAMFENYPDEARRIALKAHKLLPSFVPAGNVAAQILFSLEEMRKGSRLVEAMWKAKPHPDLGLTYVNAGGQGESAAGRLRRARQLAKLNPEDRESRMLVARTALEAGELALARKQAEAVARASPTQSTFLLLADIETAQGADQGKIRQWLAKAVQAKADMAWIADGAVLAEWQPLSPVTGHIGACRWKTPPVKSPRSLVDEPSDIALRAAARRDKQPQPLIIDMAAGNAAQDGAAGYAPATGDPSQARNIDGEPFFSRTGGAPSSPATRIIVDDPGISDEPEELDTVHQGSRLF